MSNFNRDSYILSWHDSIFFFKPCTLCPWGSRSIDKHRSTIRVWAGFCFSKNYEVEKHSRQCSFFRGCLWKLTLIKVEQLKNTCCRFADWPRARWPRFWSRSGCGYSSVIPRLYFMEKKLHTDVTLVCACVTTDLGFTCSCRKWQRASDNWVGGTWYPT